MSLASHDRALCTVEPYLSHPESISTLSSHPEKPTRQRPFSPCRHLSFIVEDILYHDFSLFYLFLNYVLYLSFWRVWISTMEEPISIFLTLISWVPRIRIGMKRRKITEHGRDLQQCSVILNYSITRNRRSILNCFLLDLEAKSIRVLWITPFYWIHR